MTANSLSRIQQFRRLLETVRHLRIGQVVNRASRSIKKPAIPSQPSVCRARRRGAGAEFLSRPASLREGWAVEFHGQSGTVDSPGGWNDPSFPKLWLYNLHYFDGLLAHPEASSASVKRSFVTRWIDENPPGSGTGWDPYPCSLRICNWIKWVKENDVLEPAIERSLALQVAWLARNIEWHLLGNHLFENARALVFAGHFFEGQEADRWLARGLEILKAELPEQILPDGGQFERSPMYHLIALEGLLDLINVSSMWPGRIETAVLRQWTNIASKMCDWMSAMCHDDGEIALFNDSAFGIAQPPGSLKDYALALGVEVGGVPSHVEHLAESGYVRARVEEALLLADIGEIGPDYLPGHAHADTLSFELSLFGRRLLVDTGCSTYDSSPERLRQRGTGAHNTVMIDGEDSSEVWSSFRVARRARPFDVVVREDAHGVRVAAAHDGYKRLPGKVTHRREWWLGHRRLEIVDSLSGGWKSARATLLFHPDVAVSEDGGQIDCDLAGRRVVFRFEGGSGRIEAATWHPEFGTAIPTTKLRIDLDDAMLKTTIEW